MKRVCALILLLTFGIMLTGCGALEAVTDAIGNKTKITIKVEMNDDAPSDDASEAELEAIRQTLQDRLAYYWSSDFKTHIDNGKDLIVISTSEAVDEEQLEGLLAMPCLTIRNDIGEVVMDGDDVESAMASVSNGGSEYTVILQFTPEGGEKFARITEENIGKQISIFLDDTLLSNPTVNAAITDGSAQINGSFTADEAVDLANHINAAVIPCTLSIVSVK